MSNPPDLKKQPQVLEGQVAIVTGGARGIGRAIAEILSRRGANVVINYSSPSSKAKAEELARSLPTEVLVIQADIGSIDGPKSLVRKAIEKWNRIDIIVNNSGVCTNAPLGEIDFDDMAVQYNVNVRGPLILVQEAVPYKPSRIVNVSSISATAGFPTQSVYGGTKGALDAMTRVWASELGNFCTVNSVNPGPVKTEMWYSTTDEFKESLKPVLQNTSRGQRAAEPSDIAGIVAMLCDPTASGWCTGSIICANGGVSPSR